MTIEWLINKTKKKFYPITHAKAVLCGEASDKSLPEVLDGLFPKSGGTASGSIGVNGGLGGVSADGNVTYVTAYDITNDDNNKRSLMVATHKFCDGQISQALLLRDVINGSYTDYAVFHSGNSAKVAIQESAPEDTTALWVW